MKNTLFSLLFLLILPFSAFTQKKDTRALLSQEILRDISVSPSGKIWLTTSIGKMFFTEDIDSAWHVAKPLPPDKFPRINIYQSSFLLSIDFFNADIAILTGFIGTAPPAGFRNEYYYTINGGKTWEKNTFPGGDTWIYDVCIGKNGNAWMSGSTGKIFFSNDYGKNWKDIGGPYNGEKRTLCLFMTNENEGYAGEFGDEINYTTDNWKTYRKIETPADQGLIPSYKWERAPGISKIATWNDKIIVRQERRCFISERNNIHWRPMPGDTIVDFSLDPQSNKLWCIDSQGRVAHYSAKEKLEWQSDPGHLPNPPNSIFVDMKAVNGNLYAVDETHKVYKIDVNSWKTLEPFTTDFPIPKPGNIKRAFSKTIGVTNEELLLSDNDGKTWYREKRFDFWVDDFNIQDESSVILWDDEGNNYIHSLIDHSTEKYEYHNLLQKFLEPPLLSFEISVSHIGPGHSRTIIEFKREGDNNFHSTGRWEEENFEERVFKPFSKTVSCETFEKILQSINTEPGYVPGVEEFKITGEEIDEFIKDANIIVKEDFPFAQDTSYDFFDQTFLEEFPLKVKKISKQDILEILNRPEEFHTSDSYIFKVTVVNRANGSLVIEKDFYSHQPWMLPWTFNYDGQYFNCMNIDFSRFILSCLPDKFEGKEAFSNQLLLKEIARFLKEGIR